MSRPFGLTADAVRQARADGRELHVWPVSMLQMALLDLNLLTDGLGCPVIITDATEEAALAADGYHFHGPGGCGVKHQTSATQAACNNRRAA